jgi:hypothetical protein
MPSVIMIAHHFPPEGSAGAYRPLRFVRHLPSLGWHPTVVTLQTDTYERYDPALLEQIPKCVEVIRVPNPDPWQALLARRAKGMQQKLAKRSAEQTARILSAYDKPVRSRVRELVRSLEARLYHPDIAMGWITPAVKAIKRACQSKPADVIWATAGPVSSFHVAEGASRRTGIPYVLDFRDAWTITFNEFEARRPRWATLRDWKNMFRFLKGARAAIFRSHAEAQCYYRGYHGALEPDKIHILPNGFEGNVKTFTASNGTKCEFLYTGTLGDYRYDTLLYAIRSLKTLFPSEAGQMHFHFVGEGTEAISKQADTFNLTDVITSDRAMPQSAVAELSKKAHALLLLGRATAMKGHELFAAAKLFGYLKAGKPIVGILPNDEAKRILQRVGVSTVADVDSRDEIVAVLRRVLHSWADGTLESLAPDSIACRAYSAETQTQALIAALEGAPALDPFVPGTVDIPDSLGEEISRREDVFKKLPLRAWQNEPISANPLRNHP